VESHSELAERSVMSLALKLDRARQNLEYWQKMAEDPKLPPAAAQTARDQIRTYKAAVARCEKPLAYLERNRLERSRRTLGE
jgi:hypothetical protein